MSLAVTECVAWSRVEEAAKTECACARLKAGSVCLACRVLRRLRESLIVDSWKWDGVEWQIVETADGYLETRSYDEASNDGKDFRLWLRVNNDRERVLALQARVVQLKEAQR